MAATSSPSAPLTDADARVAEDALRERFSPVKPYRYEWFVEVNRSGERLLARLSAIDPESGEVRRFQERLPPLADIETAWAPQVESMFGVLELLLSGKPRTYELRCEARLDMGPRCELYEGHPGPHQAKQVNWS